MNDDEFLAAFESGAIANADFRHREHLRMAWLYVRRDGPAIGAFRIREGIRRFATVHGVSHLYHETLTVFWTRLMAHAAEAFPELDRFEDVLGGNPGRDCGARAVGRARPSTAALMRARRRSAHVREETRWPIV